ncbi:MAG: hypothetical protein ACFFH0_11655 [Promethearchaeota archaeon]
MKYIDSDYHFDSRLPSKTAIFKVEGGEMAREPITSLSNSDIHFLVETVAPELLDKLEIIKNDPEIIQGMMEKETHQLLQRIMHMNDDTIMTAITPKFFLKYY